MPAATDSLAGARSRAVARSRKERASASPLGARLLELGATLVLTPGEAVASGQRLGKSLLAVELATRSLRADVAVERSPRRAFHAPHLPPRELVRHPLEVDYDYGEDDEVARVVAGGRELDALDRESGEGEWLLTLEGEVLVGLAARRWWLRRTAESALARAGWDGTRDFDDGPASGLGTTAKLADVGAVVVECVRAAVEERARVVLACPADHHGYCERVLERACLDVAYEDDALDLLEHVVEGAPVANGDVRWHRMLNKRRFKGGGWVCVAPREWLAFATRWPGDAPTRAEATPQCDWVSFPFPTTSGCEEAGDAR